MRPQLTFCDPATDDTPLPDHSQPCADIAKLNVQMSLRPQLRALDVLVREYQYLLTLHVQDSGTLVLRTVHPLYHYIEARQRFPAGAPPSCIEPQTYTSPAIVPNPQDVRSLRTSLLRG